MSWSKLGVSWSKGCELEQAGVRGASWWEQAGVRGARGVSWSKLEQGEQAGGSWSEGSKLERAGSKLE